MADLSPVEHHQTRSTVEMAEWYRTTSSPLSHALQMVPTSLPTSGQGCSKDVQKEGYRKDKIPKVPQQALLSAQTELSGNENHFGPLTAEQVHREPFLQDANPHPGEAASSPRSVDCESSISRMAFGT